MLVKFNIYQLNKYSALLILIPGIRDVKTIFLLTFNLYALEPKYNIIYLLLSVFTILLFNFSSFKAKMYSSILKRMLLLAIIVMNCNIVLAEGLQPAKTCSSSSSSPYFKTISSKSTESNSNLSSHDRMHVVYKVFMDAFMYPNNIVQAKSINSTLFSEDIQGRVDLTNDFDGRELNTEYIFGLFANIANNKTFSLLSIPVAYEERAFISSGNIASTSSLVMFRDVATGFELPMVVDIFLGVDNDGKINKYDATFKRHDWFFDFFDVMIVPFIAKSLNIPAASINETYLYTINQQLVAKSVCSIAQEYCTGTNQQYDSYEDCENFMMSLPFGTSYGLGLNIAECRMLHQEMVSLRPSVHCDHIGPSGGDMCIDRNYIEVTNAVYFRQKFIE